MIAKYETDSAVVSPSGKFLTINGGWGSLGDNTELFAYIDQAYRARDEFQRAAKRKGYRVFTVDILLRTNE